MDKSVTAKAPYFDAREVGAELAELVARNGGAQPMRALRCSNV